MSAMHRVARRAAGVGRANRWLPAAAALTLALASATARAQPARDSLAISVLTMGPGPEVFERFGHISIRVHNLRTNMDTAYNWGMFSFDQPRFLVRFLTGDTRYWMQGYPTMPLVKAYQQVGRWVVEQELALSAPQADSLWRYIQWNAKEDNKWYRYDYYLDNCSTRVRDVLDLVLGGAFKRAVVAREQGVTYRSETLRLATAYPFLDFAMDFALGRPADATISAWDEMFVPMRLRALLREVRVPRPGGRWGRLVTRETVLVADDRFAEPAAPPDQLWPALAAGLGVADVLLLLSMLTGRARAARWGIATVGVAWHLLAGVAGALLLCAGLFTRHVFMARNVNLLLATPASLALAFLIPFAVSRVSGARLVRAVRALGVFAVACGLAAVALRLVASLSQENRPLLALAVPVQAALAFALWRATATRSATPPVSRT